MKLSSLVVGCSLVAGCAAQEIGQSESEVAGGAARYLVVFRADTLPADAGKHVTQAGGTVTRLLPQVGVVAAVGDAAFASKLAADGAVLSVGLQHVYGAPATERLQQAPYTVTDPSATAALYPLQWDIRRVGAPAVWARWPSSAPTPRVAVLDVGVADDHYDLIGQVDASKAFTYCAYSGGAGYPYYDQAIDFSLAQPACVPVAGYYEGHGTHVSGTIAGTGHAATVGVAPQAHVGAYKVFDRIVFPGFDDVGGFDENILGAMIDAANSGYPVISMSLGGTLQFGPYGRKDAAAAVNAWKRVATYVNQKGTLVVAAAGNSSLDLNGTTFNIPSDLPTVMAVSATGTSTAWPAWDFSWPPPTVDAATGSDVLAFYSNYGSSVDVSAPGGDLGPGFPGSIDVPHLILSTYVTPDGELLWAWAAGTSMATPHVSAVAAQVRALHPSWSPGTVRSWLKSNAEPIGPRQYFGQGLVNADRAVR